MGFLRVNVRVVSLSVALLLAATGSSALAKAVAGTRDSKTAKAKKLEQPESSAKKPQAPRGRIEQGRLTSQKTPVKATTASSKLSNTKAQKKNSRDREQIAEATASKKLRETELRRAEERRRAESARAAAIAREKARNEELRDQVQAMIAKDDLRGEDAEVRRVAVNALGNHAGTVIVMNPQTGRVLSIVNQEWALHEGFKPCSTIKLVTGLAGLNENVIDPADTTRISDNNQVSLTRALAYSRNGYFQQVGQQVGFEKMVSYARQLGLGEKTGINVRNEFQGKLPGSDARANIHRISSHGDNFRVTAIQLATLVSAVANGGKLVTPFIARTRQDEFGFKTRVRRKVNLSPDAWGQMVPGMVAAVNYGSGKLAHDPSQTVVGKTGTCIEEGSWVGLFTSYAPVANPKLAVVVITRGADARSHFPAAVAGRIYRDLSGRFGTSGNVQLAGVRQAFTPDANDESDDEEESEARAVNENRRAMGLSVPQPPVRRNTVESKVRTVSMPLPKRTEVAEPKITPVVIESVGAEGQTRPRRVFGE